MSALLMRICERRHWLAIAGWLITVAFLVIGVPLFVRMPLWCDATLHEISARNMLAGGVHYRDVLDTNPPGFGWMLCAVRVLFGPSSEAVRIVDLAIIVAITTFLLVWARTAGATSAGVAWMAAAIAAFYPFIHEFNHVQRDVWMMLPAAVAIGLRLRRIESTRRPTAMAFLEGMVWGLGCWVKPHLLIVAACVWLVSANRIGSIRAVIRDFVADFAGGVVMGLMGLGWLIGTGAWPYFLDVWQNWNTAYAEIMGKELPYRIFVQQLNYFPPYSCFVLLAVPVALCNLRDRSSPDPARFRRAMLATVYLSWLLNTLLLQRGFHYAHVPETLLMLAVFTANRWPVPAGLVLIQIIVGISLLVADRSPELMETHHQIQTKSWAYRNFTERNAAFNPDRTRWWVRCFDSPSRELRKGVGMWIDHFGGLNPVELGAVADFLREQGVRDGELIAWHDSPHELYLELGIKPGFRFMHVGTMFGLGKWQREQVLRELQAAIPHARFVVSDMHRITKHHDRLNEVGPDGLPLLLPAWQCKEFPFNQPVVFRSPSGRYLVHMIRNPVTSCVIPEKLDQELPKVDPTN
ncbi:MAG TPA: hypothetical protein VG122_19610 [Gemmata sp.]|nr:hypothetical protein [Gemmata sp.]